MGDDKRPVVVKQSVDEGAIGCAAIIFLIVLLIGIYQITDLVFDRLERLERVQQGIEVKRG